MTSRLIFVGKFIAITVLLVGAVAFINARGKHKDKDTVKAEPFAITYRVTRTEPGKAPVVIGLIVRVDNARGGIKDTRFLDNGSGAPIRLQTRFFDTTAAYIVDGDHLEYIESSEGMLEGDQNARSASWATSSPNFLREETTLGMRAYVVHQDLTGGFWEAAYTPALARTPLIDREVAGGVETTREAVSVQFRPVSDEEVAVPNLPIRFDRATAQHELFRSGGSEVNIEAMNKADERMLAARERLQRLGRVE